MNAKIFFLLLFFLMAMIVWLWDFFDSLFCVEDIVTNEVTTRKVSDFLNQNYTEGILYDLGSSRGKFAVDIAEASPQLAVTGVDNSLLRVMFSRMRAVVRRQKVVFKHANMFTADISKADLVYVYIPRVLLPKLARKLENDLRPGAVVITNRITFLDWQPNRVIRADPEHNHEEDIFVYESPFTRA